jgi:hypothetical protein
VKHEHEVILLNGAHGFSCDAWGMHWAYRSEASAEFFLAAHLSYPVAPCVGLIAPARTPSATNAGLQQTDKVTDKTTNNAGYTALGAGEVQP